MFYILYFVRFPIWLVRIKSNLWQTKDWVPLISQDLRKSRNYPGLGHGTELLGQTMLLTPEVTSEEVLEHVQLGDSDVRAWI